MDDNHFDKFEPAVRALVARHPNPSKVNFGSASDVSIAISLKRIADLMQRNQLPTYDGRILVDTRF